MQLETQSIHCVIKMCDSLLHLGLIICNIQWDVQTKSHDSQVIRNIHITEEFQAILTNYRHDVDVQCSLCFDTHRSSSFVEDMLQTSNFHGADAATSQDDLNHNYFPLLHPATIAYWLHTTGTTGQPKLVRVPHCSIVPNVIDLMKRFTMSPDDIVFNSSPLTFDPSVIEVRYTMVCSITVFNAWQSFR